MTHEDEEASLNKLSGMYQNIIFAEWNFDHVISWMCDNLQPFGKAFADWGIYGPEWDDYQWWTDLRALKWYWIEDRVIGDKWVLVYFCQIRLMIWNTPAVACLDFTPHTGVGEVAARLRRN
jgi:hypothetical protein